MLNELITFAKNAGAAILKIYYSEKSPGFVLKSDLSPLTEADLQSNRILVCALRKKFALPILSEEMTVDYQERKKWTKFWLLDPLDGTKEFLSGNGEFTINIALIESGKPVLGLIYAPALNLLYFAEDRKGAFCNGRKIYNRSSRKNLIALDSRFHSTNATKLFFVKHGIKKIATVGAALKYGKIAEGKADIYPRFNGTKEWDTAAGQIILQQAGGKMIDYQSQKELRYNKPDIKNNYFIASRKDLNFLN